MNINIHISVNMYVMSQAGFESWILTGTGRIFSVQNLPNSDTL
jgi:hypothetical protein